MNTIKYLAKAKEKLGLKSDYALAKWLGITVGAVSHYQTGKRVIDDYTAARIAEALGVDPMEVIATANAEREKDEGRRDYWRKIFQKATLTSTLLIFFSFGISHLESANMRDKADYAAIEKQGGRGMAWRWPEQAANRDKTPCQKAGQGCKGNQRETSGGLSWFP